MNKQLLTIATAAALSTPVLATPIYDTFGPLPEATFGGTGIPNSEVAAGSQIVDGSTTITVAMSATQRYSNPALTSDGAGTYTALAGSNDGGNAANGLGAMWNFNFYIEVDGAGKKITDYQFDLYYDFDPGFDTPLSGLGKMDITGIVAGSTTPNVTVAQSSQNLLFNYLENPGSPGNLVITPPAGSFDPNALGEYNFVIVASSTSLGLPVEIAAIDVQVVPEPSSLALLGLGGLGLLRRRRK